MADENGSAAPEAPKRLVSKLAEVMAAVERVPKRGRNDFHGYDYATEADIAGVIRKELASRHVMLIPGINKQVREHVGEKGSVLTTLEMTFTFLDGDTDEQITRAWLGAGTDKEDKGLYKAMTGAEKYFLLKTFLMPTGDDPEKEDAAPKRERVKAGRQSGESPTEYAARRPESPGEASEDVRLTFGSAKGMSVRETPSKDLAWYRGALSENVVDPKKAKWREGNQRLLDAVVAELERREQTDDAPFAPSNPDAVLALVEPWNEEEPVEANRVRFLSAISRMADKYKLTTAERLQMGVDFLDAKSGKTADIKRVHALYLVMGDEQSVKDWRAQRGA